MEFIKVTRVNEFSKVEDKQLKSITCTNNDTETEAREKIPLNNIKNSMKYFLSEMK